MPWPLRILQKGRLGGLLVLMVVGPCVAAPLKSPTPLPAQSPTQSSSAVPDYGGRDAPGLLSGAGTAAPDPAAQAGRALLSLVLVLGGVFGVVTLLKRGGYTGGGPVGAALMAGLRQSVPGSPKTVSHVNMGGSGPLTLLQSQSLPGGGTIHLLSVDDRALMLVGATAQGVSLLAEWASEVEASPPEESPETAPTFQDFLDRTAQNLDDTAPISPLPAEHIPERVTVERLSDLLSTQHVQTRERTRP